jgi:hypothetical protein
MPKNQRLKLQNNKNEMSESILLKINKKVLLKESFEVLLRNSTKQPAQKPIK